MYNLAVISGKFWNWSIPEGGLTYVSQCAEKIIFEKIIEFEILEEKEKIVVKFHKFTVITQYNPLPKLGTKTHAWSVTVQYPNNNYAKKS